MRFAFALLALLVTGAAYADPPKITISPSGDTTIKSGLSIITLKADGTVSIKGPNVDLTLPGAITPSDPEKPTPPPIAPEKDPLADLIGTLYGSLQEDGKAEKTKTLSQVWLKAVALVDKCDTMGDLHGEIKKLTTLKDDDLGPIREAIRDEIARELGNKASTKIDKVKARALFGRVAAALEKAVS